MRNARPEIRSRFLGKNLLVQARYSRIEFLHNPANVTDQRATFASEIVDAGLARSIVRQPSCILYDEPTSGLDPIVSDSINRLIRRLQERLGVTSIVVTHDMKNAFHVADRIAYLHEGKIHFQGTPEELRQSADQVVQDFLLGRSEEQLTPKAFEVES